MSDPFEMAGPHDLRHCGSRSCTSPGRRARIRNPACALDVYEVERLDFAEAYHVASAEASGVEAIASFDRAIDRFSTPRRIEPS